MKKLFISYKYILEKEGGGSSVRLLPFVWWSVVSMKQKLQFSYSD